MSLAGSADSAVFRAQHHGSVLAYRSSMPNRSLKSFIILAFVLFFGGIFTAGMGLGLLDGVPASFMVTVGVILAVIAPATALIGASLEEGAQAAAAEE